MYKTGATMLPVTRPLIHFRRLICACVLSLLGAIGTAQTIETVRVGAYPFLPFVDGKTGLTADLIQAMNTFQKTYRFEIVETSANRRYRDMESGQYSLIFFENIKWGWDPAQVDASKPYLTGDGEIFVARRQNGRDQTYFDDFSDKQLLGVLGYHYKFAGFDTSQDNPQNKFRMIYSRDDAVSLRNLLAGRGDIAVITKAYLMRYLGQHPQAREKLLISDRQDQPYVHTVLVKKGSKPTAQEIDILLGRMEAAGVLKPLWQRYGM